MKILESIQQPGVYRLWHSSGNEITEAVSYDDILKSIVGDEDWDPGMFKWRSEEEINFDEWREVELSPLQYMN